MNYIEPEEFRLWRAFLAAQASILPGVESELGGLTDVSLGDVEVLAALNGANGQMRMAELADIVNASRSGLTRRVDRLTRQGLVKRESVPTDKRGAYAVLTARGRRELDEVLPRYHSVVSRRFLAVFDAKERETFIRLLERLTDAGADEIERSRRI